MIKNSVYSVQFHPNCYLKLDQTLFENIQKENKQNKQQALRLHSMSLSFNVIMFCIAPHESFVPLIKFLVIWACCAGVNVSAFRWKLIAVGAFHFLFTSFKWWSHTLATIISNCTWLITSACFVWLRHCTFTISSNNNLNIKFHLSLSSATIQQHSMRTSSSRSLHLSSNWNGYTTQLVVTIQMA